MRSNTFAANINCMYLHLKQTRRDDSLSREEGISNRGNSFFFFFVRRARVIHPTLLFSFFYSFALDFPHPPPSHLFFNVDASFFFSFLFLEKTRLQKCLICSRQACETFPISEKLPARPHCFAVVITLFYNNY